MGGYTDAEQAAKSPPKKRATALDLLSALLRVLALLVCVLLVALLVSTHQTINLPGGISLEAKYDNTKAPVVLVAVDSVCATYALILALLSIFSICTKRSIFQNTIFAWLIFLADQIFTYVLLGAAAAAAEVGYIAKKGEEKVHWTEGCSVFKRFCDRYSGAVIVSFIAVLVFANSAAISAFYLFRRYKPVS